MQPRFFRSSPSSVWAALALAGLCATGRASAAPAVVTVPGMPPVVDASYL